MYEYCPLNIVVRYIIQIISLSFINHLSDVFNILQ
jgi:hypothetical protein